MNRTEKNNRLGLRVLTVAVPADEADEVLLEVALRRHKHLYRLTMSDDAAAIAAMAARNLSKPTTEDERRRYYAETQEPRGVAYRAALRHHEQMNYEMLRYMRLAEIETDQERQLIMAARAYACSQLHKATRDLLTQLLEKETSQ